MKNRANTVLNDSVMEQRFKFYSPTKIGEWTVTYGSNLEVTNDHEECFVCGIAEYLLGLSMFGMKAESGPLDICPDFNLRGGRFDVEFDNNNKVAHVSGYFSGGLKSVNPNPIQTFHV